jgi:hypothetical protein
VHRYHTLSLFESMGFSTSERFFEQVSSVSSSLWERGMGKFTLLFNSARD